MTYHYDTDDELLALYQEDAAKLAIHRSLLASGFTNPNPHLNNNRNNNNSVRLVRGGE